MKSLHLIPRIRRLILHYGKLASSLILLLSIGWRLLIGRVLPVDTCRIWHRLLRLSWNKGRKRSSWLLSSVLASRLHPLRGADSRVVKSLDCGARGPGFESRCRRKVVGSDWIICKYLPLWVCPEFGMRACSLFRFVLIELRHWGEPSAVLWVPV